MVKSDKAQCTAQLSNGEPIPNLQCINKVYQKQSTVSNVTKCYKFVYLKISRLLLDNGRNKSKISFLHDICEESTLFIGLCETFLNSNVLDAEVSLPGYNISRCDRRDRIGGGVCLYIKDNIGFEELLSHSNSVCEALILRLKNPDLILVNIYRPPNASCEDFNDILNEVRKCTNKLPAPLSNIIIAGDFNFPNTEWDSITISCNQAAKLKDLTDSLFLRQYVMSPTRNQNILDLVFSNDELIASVESRKTFMSDHNIVCSETNLPVSRMPTSTHNEPASRFESIDFNTSDWDRIRNSLNLVDWNAELDHLDTEQCLQSICDTLVVFCHSNSKLKTRKGRRISKFF